MPYRGWRINFVICVILLALPRSHGRLQSVHAALDMGWRRLAFQSSHMDKHFGCLYWQNDAGTVTMADSGMN